MRSQLPLYYCCIGCSEFIVFRRSAAHSFDAVSNPAESRRRSPSSSSMCIFSLTIHFSRRTNISEDSFFNFSIHFSHITYFPEKIQKKVFFLSLQLFVILQRLRTHGDGNDLVGLSRPRQTPGDDWIPPAGQRAPLVFYSALELAGATEFRRSTSFFLRGRVKTDLAR